MMGNSALSLKFYFLVDKRKRNEVVFSHLDLSIACIQRRKTEKF